MLQAYIIGVNLWSKGGLHVLLPQEFQVRLVQLQQFPWTVAAGEDEKNLRCMGKLPPKKPTLGETFLNWCGNVNYLHTSCTM